MLYGPLKVLFQIVCVWKCLAYTTKPSRWLLLQVGSIVMASGKNNSYVLESTIHSYLSCSLGIMLLATNTAGH